MSSGNIPQINDKIGILFDFVEHTYYHLKYIGLKHCIKHLYVFNYENILTIIGGFLSYYSSGY